MKGAPKPIPVYCINLAERRDRWDRMQQVATDAGVSLIRVDACDADDAGRFEPPPTKLKTQSGRKLATVEVACVLSHWKSWRMFIESNAAAAVVLEDDVVLSPDFAALLQADWIPAQADIVRIEASRRDNVLEHIRSIPGHDRQLGRMKTSQYGTGGYAITRKGAEKLINAQGAILDPIDMTMFSRRSPLFRKLVTYQMFPAPVIQGMIAYGATTEGWVASTIGTDRARLAKTMIPPAKYDEQALPNRNQATRRRLRRWIRLPFRRLSGRRKEWIDFR